MIPCRASNFILYFPKFDKNDETSQKCRTRYQNGAGFMRYGDTALLRCWVSYFTVLHSTMSRSTKSIATWCANDGELAHLGKEQEGESAIELGDNRVNSTNEVNEFVTIPIGSLSKFRSVTIRTTKLTDKSRWIDVDVSIIEAIVESAYRWESKFYLTKSSIAAIAMHISNMVAELFSKKQMTCFVLFSFLDRHELLYPKTIR